MSLSSNAVLTTVLVSLCLMANPCSSSEAKFIGLQVDTSGTLIKDGKPHCGIGVNYFNCFLRTLDDPKDTSYKEGFKTLAEYKIPFVRFAACGFWPRDFKLYKEDRETYFKQLDEVVKTAEVNHIGLIPSLFWHRPAVPDLVGEPVDQWGNYRSKTIEFMRTYVKEVVTRYKDSPAIWGWEFGNEMNLAADLPNASEHRPPVYPQLGTPSTRSERDELTHGIIRAAFTLFAREVRQYDKDRMIGTGNGFPRPSAWHQKAERSWTHDTEEQYAEMLLGDNPDLADTLSVHLYPGALDKYGRKITYDELLSETMKISQQAKKPLFIGEFGDGDEHGADTAQDNFFAMLAAIEKAKVPLSALWVFDLDNQKNTYNVTATNNRAYQLKAISEVNERIKQKLSE